MAPTVRSDRASAVVTGMTWAFHAARAPERMALISDHGDRTFAELNANTNRLVRALRSRGIREGDSLSLVCANRPEFAEVYGACMRMGVRLTPANWHLTGDELAYILDNSDAKAVIADALFADAVVTAAAKSPRVAVRLAVGEAMAGFEDYESVLAPEDGTDIRDPVLGSTMLYTSGTTGRPKGVLRPPGGSAADDRVSDEIPDAGAAVLRAIARAGRPDGEAGDCHLITGPLYHAAPMTSLTFGLDPGCTVVLMDVWDAEETLRLVDAHRVTHTHMVATMFHRLLALPAEVRAAYDVSSLRFVIHGAAPCPVAVKQALLEWLGPVVYEYYAATEGGGTFVGPYEWLRTPGTVGKPFHPAHILVQDADGTVLPPNEIGTVYMRAPARGRFRYHKDDAKTASTYRGDYFTLGDLGYLDDDGYLFLTGRSAELIISGGVNIYPAEIDAVLLRHAAVGDAGTIGVPDEEWGEEIKAVVELRAGFEPSPELAAELRAFCRARLAGFKVPRSIDFVDELPRHDNGKLYRRKLRERYVAGEDPTGHREHSAP